MKQWIHQLTSGNEQPMYLLLLDETNSQKSKENQFFVYGGVFFDLNILENLHVSLHKIRQKAGYERIDELKFDTNTRPKHVTPEAFNKAKSDILDICSEYRVRFIAYVVHHELARKHPLEQKIAWASNEVIVEFNILLQKEKTTSVCLFDNLPFPNDIRFMKGLFQEGLTTSTAKTPQIAKRTLMYGTTGSGMSYINSIPDIILGSFRYCVNASKETDAFNAILPKVHKLFHRWTGSSEENVLEYGLLLRPLNNKFYQGATNILLSKLKIAR